jgi:hypothetical protein
MEPQVRPNLVRWRPHSIPHDGAGAPVCMSTKGKNHDAGDGKRTQKIEDDRLVWSTGHLGRLQGGPPHRICICHVALRATVTPQGEARLHFWLLVSMRVELRRLSSGAVRRCTPGTSRDGRGAVRGRPRVRTAPAARPLVGSRDVPPRHPPPTRAGRSRRPQALCASDEPSVEPAGGLFTQLTHDHERFFPARSKVSHVGRVRLVLQKAVGLGLAWKVEPLKIIRRHTGDFGDILTSLLGCPHATHGRQG